MKSYPKIVLEGFNNEILKNVTIVVQVCVIMNEIFLKQRMWYNYNFSMFLIVEV